MENHVIKKKALTFLPLAICLLFKTTSITILINLPPLQIWNQIMHSREWLKLKRTSSLEKEVICPTCSSRTLQSHLPQIMFNWLWNISKVEGSTTSLSNQCQHLVASQWKMFPDIQKETPVFSSCLLPCFHSVFRYLNTLVRPPLSPLSMLNSFASLSALPHFQQRHSSPSSHLHSTLPWALSSMSVSLLYWGAQRWTHCSSCVLTTAG